MHGSFYEPVLRDEKTTKFSVLSSILRTFRPYYLGIEYRSVGYVSTPATPRSAEGQLAHLPVPFVEECHECSAVSTVKTDRSVGFRPPQPRVHARRAARRDRHHRRADRYSSSRPQQGPGVGTDGLLLVESSAAQHLHADVRDRLQRRLDSRVDGRTPLAVPAEAVLQQAARQERRADRDARQDPPVPRRER